MHVACGPRVQRGLHFVVAREGGVNQDARLRIVSAERSGGLHAAQAGKLQIHQDHARPLALICQQHFIAALCFTDDHDVALDFERGRKTTAHHEVIKKITEIHSDSGRPWSRLLPNDAGVDQRGAEALHFLENR